MIRRYETQINFSFVVLLFSLMILGCQPAGGELLPIKGGGIIIGSSRFENDTAVISDKGLTMRVYGSWDGRAKVRIVTDNESSRNIKIDFNNSAVLDSKGENIKIDSIYEDKGSSINDIKDNQFVIAAKEKHKLVIGFPLELSASLGQEPPRIISVELAVANADQPGEFIKHKFDFKGISTVSGSSTVEPQINDFR